jgi:hypothetical protein
LPPKQPLTLQAFVQDVDDESAAGFSGDYSDYPYNNGNEWYPVDDEDGYYESGSGSEDLSGAPPDIENPSSECPFC